MTYETDVLSAFSALARTFANASFGFGDYIAGIWSNEPLCLMAWYVNPADRPERHYPYTAPSWSWASIAGPAYWLGELEDIMSRYDIRPIRLPRVARTSMQPVGIDLFGRISSGFMDTKS